MIWPILLYLLGLYGALQYIRNGRDGRFREVVQKEPRSLANRMEMLTWSYCQRGDVSIPEQRVLLLGKKQKT